MATILLIEDDHAVAERICSILSENSIVVARDIEAAIACLSGNENFDMVLCEVMEHTIETSELFKRIREVNKTIPILVISDVKDSLKNIVDSYQGAARIPKKTLDDTFGFRATLESVGEATGKLMEIHQQNLNLLQDKESLEVKTNKQEKQIAVGNQISTGIFLLISLVLALEFARAHYGFETDVFKQVAMALIGVLSIVVQPSDKKKSGLNFLPKKRKKKEPVEVIDVEAELKEEKLISSSPSQDS